MSWFSGIVVYVIIWWTVFMMALPFGVDHSNKDEHAMASGAPRKPFIGWKVLITSVMAGMLTYGFDVFLESGLVSLR